MLWRGLYLLYLHPLSKYPGPRLWAISRVPWTYHVVKGDIWRAQDKLHDIYGPVVRIAPDELTYISPAVWKEIYATRPQLMKDPRSQTPPINGADSLFTADGDNHRRIKGAFINAFSDKALREQATIVEEYAGMFTQRLRAEMASSPFQIINIHKIIGYLAIDIISDLTWGESLKSMQATEDQDWISRYFLHAKFGTVRNALSRFPPMDKILHYFLLRITSKQRQANQKISEERLARRLQAGHSRSDFMTPVIGKISEHGKGITKNEVLTNSLAVVIANSQLTTIALTAAVYLLLRSPRTLTRLTEEIRTANFKSEADIKVATTQEFPYLNAVIDESLRIHHPTPGNLPRLVPQEGMMLNGEWVPGKTVVGVSLYNIHTRRENFARPLEFHPERFLAKSDSRYDAQFQNDRLEAYHPFSIGPRNCIGSK